MRSAITTAVRQRPTGGSQVERTPHAPPPSIVADAAVREEWRLYELLNRRARMAYALEADERWAYRRATEIRRRARRQAARDVLDREGTR